MDKAPVATVKDWLLPDSLPSLSAAEAWTWTWCVGLQRKFVDLQPDIDRHAEEMEVYHCRWV